MQNETLKDRQAVALPLLARRRAITAELDQIDEELWEMDKYLPTYQMYVESVFERLMSWRLTTRLEKHTKLWQNPTFVEILKPAFLEKDFPHKYFM